MKGIKKVMSLFLCAVLIAAFPCMGAAAKQEEIPLDAKAAVLMDISSGKVLYGKQEHKQLFPASITKVMSLILVMEALESGELKLTDMVTASKNAVSYGGSQIWLKEGESMSVDDMLKAVVVSSANDACTALGEHVAGTSDAFVARMNEKAKALGMRDTHFENCTGLDDSQTKHLSTAFDVALMSAELMRHELIQSYSTIWMDTLRGGETMLVNTNKLVRTFEGCIGLKTGTTSKAGFCVSAVADRDGTTLCAVILGAENSDERFHSAARLLEYGFSGYETAFPTVNLSQSGEVKVLGGTAHTAHIAPASEQTAFTVAKGEKNKVESKITLKKSVSAPVEKGAILGRADFFLNEKKIGSEDIINTKYIGRLTFWQAMREVVESLSRR